MIVINHVVTFWFRNIFLFFWTLFRYNHFCYYRAWVYLSIRNVWSNLIINIKLQKPLIITWGILNSLRRLATWMDVTLDAAPTTPEMTLLRTSGEDPSLHLYSVSSPILLIEPERKLQLIRFNWRSMSHRFCVCPPLLGNTFIYLTRKPETVFLVKLRTSAFPVM